MSASKIQTPIPSLEDLAAEEPKVDRVRLVLTLSKANFDLIRLADRKAQFLLRIALGLFGVAFIGVPPSIKALEKFSSEGGWQFALFVYVVVLYGIFAVCLMVSIRKIVGAVQPRILHNEKFPSEFFFGSVVEMEPEDFRQLVREASHDRILDGIISQIYHSAHVAHQKYRNIDQAIKWMLGGGIFGVVFALILLVSLALLDWR